MAAHTIRGYIYDLKALKVWLDDWYQQDVNWVQITPEDIQTYRTHFVKVKRHKVSAVNRRLQAIKRFYHWLQTKEKAVGKTHPAQEVRFMRIGKRTQPQALHTKEVNDLLRVAGQSPHGLGKRNYALIQLLLQSGLRIGEAAQLQIRDLCLQERSGSVTIVDGKGHKTRTVPLNATARRALQAYIHTLDPAPQDDAYVFVNKRHDPPTIRGLQKIVQTLAFRANITRLHASAHTLRHTFAHHYLKTNPGALVALSTLLGHESLNTTAIYTRTTQDDLNASVERSALNLHDLLS